MRFGEQQLQHEFASTRAAWIDPDRCLSVSICGALVMWVHFRGPPWYVSLFDSPWREARDIFTYDRQRLREQRGVRVTAGTLSKGVVGTSLLAVQRDASSPVSGIGRMRLNECNVCRNGETERVFCITVSGFHGGSAWGGGGVITPPYKYFTRTAV